MANIKSQPVLASLCGGGRVVHALATAKAESEKREALRALFSNLMNASEVEINGTLASVRKGLNAKVEMMEEDKLFLRLLEHYPGDVGCFAAYLLNYVRIRPGQAFFMSANEPHAYLKGQCVEIMANSDNVVRAGLTPKFKDVSTLLEILTYQDGPPEILTGECLDDNSILYQPPAEEFQLTKYIVPPGKTQQLHSANGPGVLLCLEGSGRVNLADSGQDNDNTGKALPLSPGCIYYVKDSEALIVESDNSADEDAAPSDLILFRAGVNQSS